MVFFTCNHCGESLKKNAVEKHYLQKKCKTLGISVGCVDCLQDFHQNEYVSHIKCITENEKYSAKGFVAKPEKNKGAQKQALWTDIIKDVLVNKPTLDGQTKQILQRISEQTNVPRKKPKFINFIRNSMKLSPNICEKVWKIIEEGLAEFAKKTQELNESAAATNGNSKAKKRKSKENDSTDTDENPSKKKKQKSVEDSSETNNESAMELDDSVEHVTGEPSDSAVPVNNKKFKKNKKNNLAITNGNDKEASIPAENNDAQTEAITLKKKKKNKNKLNKVLTDKRINDTNVVDNTKKSKKKNERKDIVVEEAVAAGGEKKKNKKKKQNQNQQQLTTPDKKLKIESVGAAAAANPKVNVGGKKKNKNKNQNQNKQQLVTADKKLKIVKLEGKKLKKSKAMQKKNSTAN